MAIQQDPSMRQPKGDHNRRLALGMDIEVFAAEAGLTRDEVHEYEVTSPDGNFRTEVAQRYGTALNRLEANPPATQIVKSGPPSSDEPLDTLPAAPAFKDAVPIGNPEDPSPVRPAGAEAMRDEPLKWDETDQASDESFPASDPPANNKFD